MAATLGAVTGGGAAVKPHTAKEAVIFRTPEVAKGEAVTAAKAIIRGIVCTLRIVAVDAADVAKTAETDS